MSETMPLVILVDLATGQARGGPLRFAPGDVVVTPGVVDLAARTRCDLTALLLRHLQGEWGDLDAEDRAVNEHALRVGARLLSNYAVTADEALWIITDAVIGGRREVTTLLLPSEY